MKKFFAIFSAEANRGATGETGKNNKRKNLDIVY